MNWMGKEEEFHSFRGKGIGSSDMPIIMGKSPWKKPFSLWQEKTGIKKNTFTGNAATRRGNELEPMVRAWYNEKYGTAMMPESKVNSEHVYLRCNSDGVDHEVKKVIEIKCGNLEDHINAYKDNKIPDKYYPQVMFLSYMYGYPIDYVSYNDRLEEAPFVVIEVAPDPEFTKEMLEMAHNFWGLVQHRTPPLIHESEDMVIEDNMELSDFMKEYRMLEADKIRIDERMKYIKEKVSGMVSHKKTVCNGYRMTWIERKGSVDYSKVGELKGVDLEQFRKAPSKFMTIKRVSSEL